MGWTITSDNFSDEPLAPAGISNLRITLQNGMDDSATFWMPRSATGTAPFAEKEEVIFRLDEVTEFTGYVSAVESHASGDREGWAVTVHGLGKILSIAPYLQTAPVAGGTAPLGSGIVLGIDSSGARLNLADTLTDILTDSATRTGCTPGTILTGYTVSGPLMECRDYVVRMAMDAVLRWIPDAVVWLDHTSSTINVERPSVLSVETRASSGDGSGVPALKLNSRRRKSVDGVIITWRTTSVVSGVSTVTVTQDTAGTTTGAYVASVTIDLTGANLTIQEETPVVVDLPTDLAEVGPFILKYWPEVAAAAPAAGQLELVSVSQEIDEDTLRGLGTLPAEYPRALIAGNIPEWQDSVSATNIVFKIVLKAGTNFGANAALSKLFGADEKLLTLTHHFLGTDAQNITYTHATGSESGEEPITGLAAAWFEALNASAPAGEIRFVGEECDTALRPGKKLTLTGDFAQTGGVIQAVTWDVDRGETLVTFGPQSRLTPADMMELARAGRVSNVVNVPGSVRTSAAAVGRKIKTGAGAIKAAEIARPAAESGWFRITQTGPTAVKVGPGCILSPEWSSVELSDWLAPLAPGSGTAVFSRYLKAYFATASAALTVAHGDKIWVKVFLGASTIESGPWSTGYASDMATEPENWPATVDMLYQWIAATGLDPIGYTASSTQPADEYSGGTLSATYLPVGSIEITSGVMTITQGQCGAHFVPGYIIPVGGPQPGWPEPDAA